MHGGYAPLAGAHVLLPLGTGSCTLLRCTSLWVFSTCGLTPHRHDVCPALLQPAPRFLWIDATALRSSCSGSWRRGPLSRPLVAAPARPVSHWRVAPALAAGGKGLPGASAPSQPCSDSTTAPHLINLPRLAISIRGAAQRWRSTTAVLLHLARSMPPELCQTEPAARSLFASFFFALFCSPHCCLPSNLGYQLIRPQSCNQTHHEGSRSAGDAIGRGRRGCVAVPARKWRHGTSHSNTFGTHGICRSRFTGTQATPAVYRNTGSTRHGGPQPVGASKARDR